jgi:hypothetical protein
MKAVDPTRSFVDAFPVVKKEQSPTGEDRRKRGQPPIRPISQTMHEIEKVM